MNQAEEIISVKNVSVTYSRWGQSVNALKNVSVTIPQGQWVLIIGPNGAGKSTFLQLLSGRIKLSEGNIFINGRAISEINRHVLSLNIFHVYQDPLIGTAPGLTVFENLVVADYDAYKNGVSLKKLKDKYLPILERVGLRNLMKQPVKYLSGGERQILTLLIANLRPAKTIILDEPFTALDPNKTEICINEVSRLNSQGKTIIQVTHDMNLANSLGDRLIAFKNGELVYDKPLAEKASETISIFWNSLTTG